MYYATTFETESPIMMTHFQSDSCSKNKTGTVERAKCSITEHTSRQNLTQSVLHDHPIKNETRSSAVIEGQCDTPCQLKPYEMSQKNVS